MALTERVRSGVAALRLAAADMPAHRAEAQTRSAATLLAPLRARVRDLRGDVGAAGDACHVYPHRVLSACARAASSESRVCT